MSIEWKYTRDNPLKVFTTFSGYDSQCLALKYIGIPFTLIGWSEIDEAAIKAHDAIFPEYSDVNYGDISKIDWSKVPDFDLLTYSSPCQDFSNAGLQAGGDEGSGTRSSLLWEVKRCILEKHPKYLLMENVKALVSEKFRPTFLKWCDWLTGQGYTSFSQVMNSKDHGCPQNRERIFVVSTLESSWFNFPQPQELKLRLKDVLEENVDEKYYLDDVKVATFVGGLEKDKLNMICSD